MNASIQHDSLWDRVGHNAAIGAGVGTLALPIAGTLGGALLGGAGTLASELFSGMFGADGRAEQIQLQTDFDRAKMRADQEDVQATIARRREMMKHPGLYTPGTF